MPWDPGAGGTVNGQISGRDGGLRQSRAEVLAGCLCRGAWQVGKEEALVLGRRRFSALVRGAGGKEVPVTTSD